MPHREVLGGEHRGDGLPAVDQPLVVPGGRSAGGLPTPGRSPGRSRDGVLSRVRATPPAGTTVRRSRRYGCHRTCPRWSSARWSGQSRWWRGASSPAARRGGLAGILIGGQRAVERGARTAYVRCRRRRTAASGRRAHGAVGHDPRAGLGVHAAPSRACAEHRSPLCAGSQHDGVEHRGAMPTSAISCNATSLTPRRSHDPPPAGRIAALNAVIRRAAGAAGGSAATYVCLRANTARPSVDPRPSRERTNTGRGRRHDVVRRCTLKERSKSRLARCGLPPTRAFFMSKKARPLRRVASRLKRYAEPTI